MSNILSDILKYLSFDDVNIDNTMFKMYYKVYGKSDRKAHKLVSLITAYQPRNLPSILIFHDKVSMAICMAGATVGIASNYFGDPIR